MIASSRDVAHNFLVAALFRDVCKSAGPTKSLPLAVATYLLTAPHVFIDTCQIYALYEISVHNLASREVMTTLSDGLGKKASLMHSDPAIQFRKCYLVM